MDPSRTKCHRVTYFSQERGTTKTGCGGKALEPSDFGAVKVIEPWGSQGESLHSLSSLLHHPTLFFSVLPPFPFGFRGGIP